MHNLGGGTRNTSYHSVNQLIKHSDFNEATLENDIALIRVKTPFVFTDDVRPVCPPEADNLYVDEKAVGHTSYEGKSLDNNITLLLTGGTGASI